MRRTGLFALMISLALLCGCGRAAAAKDGERIEAMRAELAASAGVSFSAQITFDDGQAVSDYDLLCTRSGGETRMELRAPELIAGVTARLTGENAVLEFDGLSLEAGTVGEDSLTPIAAPAAILDALEQGVVSQLRRETWDGREAVAFRVVLSAAASADLWLDAETLAPLHAELNAGEQTVIFCELSDWNLQKEG